MNYIELTKICAECRIVNNDVSCKRAIELNRCQVKIIGDEEKMYITDNTIHFKSIKEMYEKERDGLKSNTVRLFTTQELKTVLDASFTHIQILHKGTNHFFTRFITDVSYIYDKEHYVLICVFSWG